MMKLSKILQNCWVLCIPALLLLATCNRKKDPKPDYYMPQELKDYVLFPVGSYWVYYDSVSGKLDSIVLTYQEMEVAYTDVYGYHYESVDQSFYSSFSDKSFGVYCMPYNKNHSIYMYRGSLGVIISGLDTLFNDYFDTIIPKMEDSLKVLNNIYFNVKENIIYSNSEEYNYYWLKNIGTIKYNDWRGDFYLLRYHINN